MGREHWVEAALENILITLESGSRPKGGVKGINKGIPSVGAEHLSNDGGFNFSNVRFIPDSFAKSMRRGILKSEDILVVKDGATTGKTSFVSDDFPYKFACINEHVFICRAFDHLSKKYVFQYLRSRAGQGQIMSTFHGGAQGGINSEFVGAVTVPLPPVNEQKRISEKLDAILPKVKSAKARLEKIPRVLKKFRQSVLAAACSGRLTEDWREGKDDESISLDIPLIIDHGLDVPDNWLVSLAANACKQVESGSTPKGKPFSITGDIPYLKVYNIVDQKISFEYRPQFIPSSVHERELKRCKCYPNDVLMNIVGPPLGKFAIVTNQFKEWNINQAIVVFRPLEILNHVFLYYWLCSLEPIKDILNETRGSAGQANISLTQSRNILIPIPPLSEQHEIVRRVEKLFALADSLEAKYKKAMERVEKLEQSVLAKAFRGELVEPDPNDEPAEVLLKRILEEKAKLEGGKKLRKKKSA